MALNIKTRVFVAALASSTFFVSSTLIASAQDQTTTIGRTAPAPAPSAVTPAALADTFADSVYEGRRQYFSKITQEISFRAENIPDSLRNEFSETFLDLFEASPRRTNWMTPTDTGWVSAGGADLYEVHKALMAAPKSVKDGKTMHGPLTIAPTMQVDLTDKTKRVEARFGNKILAFRSVENRDAYARLAAAGQLLEVQDMQCAMAPVHPTRPHLAGATLMVVNAVEHKGKDGQPVYVRTYNSAHVAASYDMSTCQPISNAAFRSLSDRGRTATGAAVLVSLKRLDDMRPPAFTPINPIQNIVCAPLAPEPVASNEAR